MFKHHTTLGAALAFAVVALLFIPANAMAQRGRLAVGSRFVGGYVGPRYGGGYIGPRYVGGYRGYGAWRYGAYPYRNFGLYGGFYAYPYSYGIYNYPTYNYTAPSVYMLGTSAAPPGTGSEIYSSGYEPPVPVDYSAPVQVRVPSGDAQVWFDDVLTTQTGYLRSFNTPQLKPGVEYSYHVRARWTEDSKDIEQSRTVIIRAGQPAVIDFTRPATEPLPRPSGEK
jgi:uncharacterized protein (TIGR03000 family)